MRPLVLFIETQDQNYWFKVCNFVTKGCFDPIPRYRSTTVAENKKKIRFSDIKRTLKRFFWRFQEEFTIQHLNSATCENKVLKTIRYRLDNYITS